MKFKFLEHTADVKFQAFGNSLEECFENAAFALVDIVCKEKIKTIIKKDIKIEGKDLEELLYNFLEEFLFLIDSKNFIFGKFKKIKIYKKNDRYQLHTEILGDNLKNYQTETGIKAITYNEMWVTSPSEDGGKKFVCQVVVDV
ncbi:MAG: archease [Candidatus Pacearchaeota archaeon]|jgi:SHS2 domain-containing protein